MSTNLEPGRIPPGQWWWIPDPEHRTRDHPVEILGAEPAWEAPLRGFSSEARIEQWSENVVMNGNSTI